jgi:ATP synthase protein I
MFHAFRACLPKALAHNIGRLAYMAENETDEVPTSPQDARLNSLNERLKHAEKVEAARAPDQIDASTVVRNVGQRVAQSLIGMPLGGAIIGWLLDRLFDTAPWIMLALMFIGFAGAVLDVMRYSRGSGK